MPIMQCGHYVSVGQYKSTAGGRLYQCKKCIEFSSRARVVDFNFTSTIDFSVKGLEGRKARCIYFYNEGIKPKIMVDSPCKGKSNCNCEQNSDQLLTDFRIAHNYPFDSFYCGCQG